MDLNDLRNDQTPQDGAEEAVFNPSEEALVPAAEPELSAEPEPSSEPEPVTPQLPEPEQEPPAPTAQISAPPAQEIPAPTPETMQFPNPADYGWQTAQPSAPQGYDPRGGTYYRAPAAPNPAQYPPRGYQQNYPQGYPQGYPQQNYYRGPYQNPQPQGYARNTAPYGYAQNGYAPNGYGAPNYAQNYAPNYAPNYAVRSAAAPPQTPSAPKKEKMSGGTKAVFAVIIALVVASLGFFVGYVIRDSHVSNSGPDFPNIPEWNLPVPGDPEESRPQENPPEESRPEPDLHEPSEPEESRPERDYEVIPNTEGIRLDPLPEGEELSAKEIYVEIKNSIVGVIVEEGTSNESQGSGIIATEDGYIITNAHVVLNRRSVNVQIATLDETRYEAVVVGFDKTTDLAVLKVVGTADTFEPASFGDSDSLCVGDWVLAIGNPGGQDFASSLTRGIVSAVDRKVGTNSSSGMTYIQTDAAINPGNSGGALVNMAGQVVGINSSKIVAAEYEGMGFAIPITKAKAIIDDLMANGYVVGRARLGIRGRNITAYAATLNGLPQGFEIVEFPEESPFLSVDAKVGDIITAIDGETVTTLTDITNILARHSPGDSVEISLYRYEGLSEPQTVTVRVTLLEDKGETQE